MAVGRGGEDDQKKKMHKNEVKNGQCKGTGKKKKKTVQVVMSVIRPKLWSMIGPVNAILCAQESNNVF